MKAILEFNLPEDQEEFDVARDGGARSAAMHEFDQQVMRSIVKYDAIPEELIREITEHLKKEYQKDMGEEHREIVFMTTEYLRSKFYETANEYDVSIL